MPAADASGILQDARERGLNVLDEPSAKRLLGLFGIASPRGCVLRSSKDLGALGTLQAPFVLKTVSPQIVHKSDVGAVRLGLRDSAAVGAAIDELDAALRAKSIEVPAWLVEEMAPGGVECVVGGMHDAEFGPMVMVGLGGVFVEVMRDVSFRICPVSRARSSATCCWRSGVSAFLPAESTFAPTAGAMKPRSALGQHTTSSELRPPPMFR